ncbi:MAG: NTP transferase domain-containing protein [Nanoarchaeota archaeon]|nr:NTP transferase domain-containing protein [Nanoarchaeota archaeon]
MKVVIMAGGLGTRLRPLTHIIPKPLLPLGEQTILEITINKLKNHGFKEFILATNYKSDLFAAYLKDGSQLGVSITYSKEAKPLGTAGPLKLLASELNEPFIVINGDIITNLDFSKLYSTHISSKAKMTVVTKILQTPLQYGVITAEGDSVSAIEEKPNLKFEILAGIYVLSPEVLNIIPEGMYNMPQLIRDLISCGENVRKYVLEDYWLDVGQMESYEQAQKDVKEGII